ncbi:MAG: FtsX-like permease family protein, partial [bacterium]|nr:FtsX-like permease family protein [bacterium]
KGANALITLEIFLSLLVVFALSAIVSYSWIKFRRPLGFEIDNLWSVVIRVDPGQRGDSGMVGATARRLLQESRTLDPVMGGTFSLTTPYGPFSSLTSIREGDAVLRFENEYATPELRDLLGIELVAGRWFEPADAALPWIPVVVNRRLALEVFGDEDPLGQILSKTRSGKPQRVIGLIEDYRRHGELSGPRNVAFEPLWLDGLMRIENFGLLLSVRPGTRPAFEEELGKHLEGVAPTWSFTVRALEEMRESYLKSQLVLLLVVGIVAVFLMLMVALGLVGVLWQNVTQRTREMGLRRAKGATAAAVRRQILIEVTLMTSFAVVLAAVITAQLWLTGIFGAIDFGVYALAFALAAAMIYLLTVLCGLYPSWLATRIQPAEALHYE